MVRFSIIHGRCWHGTKSKKRRSLNCLPRIRVWHVMLQKSPVQSPPPPLPTNDVHAGGDGGWHGCLEEVRAPRSRVGEQALLETEKERGLRGARDGRGHRGSVWGQEGLGSGRRRLGVKITIFSLLNNFCAIALVLLFFSIIIGFFFSGFFFFFFRAAFFFRT